jgi:hypothetical protein
MTPPPRSRRPGPDAPRACGIIGGLPNSAEGWSIVPLDASREPAYADLVARAPASPITHTLAWRDLLVSLGLGRPRYLLALRDGQLRAALPAFVQGSAAGAVLNSLPLVQSTGGVITPADCGPDERAQVVRLLVGAMLQQAAAEDVRVACLIGSPHRSLEDAAALPRPPDYTMVRTTNVLDLRAPLALRPSIVGSIRKAERAAPVHRVATTPTEARAVHDLYAASMQRLGASPHPWRLFEPLLPHARFVWAEVDGAMVSGLILLVHREVLEYHSVGNSEAGRQLQTNSWLCLRELEWAARQPGLRWWNWGASPNAAVHDFKRRWGGADRPYSIWGFVLGDVAPWRRLNPQQLAAEFPSYFVLPYDQLVPRDLP